MTSPVVLNSTLPRRHTGSQTDLSDVAQRRRADWYIGQRAIQLLGGIGMTNELNVDHSFTRLTAIDTTHSTTTTIALQAWCVSPLSVGILYNRMPIVAQQRAI